MLSAALFFPVAQADTYYVSTSGDDTSDGLSEAQAWRSLAHAGGQVAPGDTVYVEAGDYGADPLTVGMSGTADQPIELVGYQSTPGDEPSLGWSYPDSRELDPAVMPLIDGHRVLEVGIDVTQTRYVHIRNFQVTATTVGVYGYQSANIELENIVVYDVGDAHASYSGHGIILSPQAQDNAVRNCVVYNAPAEGISIGGDNNLVEDCTVVADDDTDNAATDYYLFIGGSDNTVRGNTIERVGDLDHGGAGIGIKGDDSGVGLFEGNLLEDNTAINLGSPFYVRHRMVQNNTFQNNTVIGGEAGILIRDGASNNVFDATRVSDSLYGITFMDTDEDGGATWAGSNNLVTNSIFTDTDCVIAYSYYSEDSPAYDNIFANLTIAGAGSLTCAERENYGNVLFNSVVVGVDALASGAVSVDLAIHHTAFFDSGFDMPKGEGNIAADPLFVDAESGNLQLQKGSPCIDAGSAEGAPAEDIEGQARPSGVGVDMGAYEFTASEGDTGGDDTGGDDTGGATGDTGDTGSSAGGTGGGDSGDASGEADAGGCGCSSRAGPTPWWGALVVLLAVHRRRGRM